MDDGQRHQKDEERDSGDKQKGVHVHKIAHMHSKNRIVPLLCELYMHV